MRPVAAAALVALATVLLFVLLEGGASVLISAWQLTVKREIMAEVAHTEYDPLLGWVNLADFRAEDMYGPGVYLQTSAQRFRNDRVFPGHVPPGRFRFICSGDSFTLGYGVDNEHTWCESLARRDTAWEAVNMGQGGYGVDQAYLWYMRDGAVLDHQLHILAIITPDFDRMTQDNFLGYGRPVLKVVDGELVTTNVPVPETRSAVARFDALQRAVSRLRIVELGGAALRRLGWQPRSAVRVNSEADVQAVTRAMLETLRRENEAKGSTFAVVYLPRSTDAQERDADPWRGLLEEEARRSGLIYIDLIARFRDLPLDVGQNLFLRPYRASHYSVAGNQWVADALFDELRTRNVLPAAAGR